MILFAFDSYREMATILQRTADLTLGAFRVTRFENGEMNIAVETQVANERCLILGSIAPPDEQLLSALLLTHTLKKEGARHVTAAFPYLAYARHDKAKPGDSLATAWAGALAQASGIDQVITVDVHSERARKLFPIPVLSLSPAKIFAQALIQNGLSKATIVAPDEGAIGRCQDVQIAAGVGNERIPYFEKHRTATGITHGGPIGKVGPRAVITDDILDTGGTLLSACEKLNEAGVEEINVMVTHGLFTGERWKKLWQVGVKRIFCTDSVPVAAGVDGSSIVRLSVAPLLTSEFMALANE